MEYKIKLISKRNEVYLVSENDEKFIHKVYKNDEACLFEQNEILRLEAKGVKVPKIVCRKGNTLVMKYIEGQILIDIIKAENIEPKQLAKYILDWFEAFYRAAEENEIRGDINCRNFILTAQNVIYSVDFEERSYGEKAADAGRICQYVLSYIPVNTPWKLELSKYIKLGFYERFKVSLEDIEQERIKEIEVMKKRRGKKKYMLFNN